MASRRSLRLSGLEPEFASIDSICGVCEKKIDVNLRNCKITSCCSKPIHKKCLGDLFNANGPWLYCPGRFKQKALEELNKLMRPENIMAAITRVSRVVFSPFSSATNYMAFCRHVILVSFSRQGTMRWPYFFLLADLTT